MAQKKKKKIKNKPRQKEIQAQHKNEFLRQIKRIVIASDAREAFDMIPKDEIKFLTYCRYRPLKILPAEGMDVDNRIINRLQESVTKFLKQETFTILPDREEITLFDYYTAVLPLKHYLRTLDDDKYSWATEVKAGFKHFLKRVDEQDDIVDTLIEFANSFSIYLSRINTVLYWFTPDHINTEEFPPVIFECLYFHFQKGEKIYIKLDGIKRIVYRIGWALTATKMVWSYLKPSNLNIDSNIPDIPVKVYIQSHAFERLKERLDCVEECLLHFYIYYSLSVIKPEITVIDTGKVLIDYYILDNKLGYLVVEYVEGVAVVRTFLFLTNSGTPEGKKLHEKTQLEIMEKKYLSIDKLSTFVISDVRNDENLKRLFTEAGCGSLFGLNKNDITTDAENKQLAEDITKYLGLQYEPEENRSTSL